MYDLGDLQSRVLVLSRQAVDYFPRSRSCVLKWNMRIHHLLLENYHGMQFERCHDEVFHHWILSILCKLTRFFCSVELIDMTAETTLKRGSFRTRCGRLLFFGLGLWSVGCDLCPGAVSAGLYYTVLTIEQDTA